MPIEGRDGVIRAVWLHEVREDLHRETHSTLVSVGSVLWRLHPERSPSPKSMQRPEFRPSRQTAVAARKQTRAITSAEGDEDWFDSMNVFESYLVSLHLLISKSIRVFIYLPDMKSQIGGVCGELIKNVIFWRLRFTRDLPTRPLTVLWRRSALPN